MELLDNKHVQALGGHLAKLIKGLADLHAETVELLSGPPLFPVEVDLSNSAFQYKSTTPVFTVGLNLLLIPKWLQYFCIQHNEDEDQDEDVEQGEEVLEQHQSPKQRKPSIHKTFPVSSSSRELEADVLVPLIPEIPILQSEPDYEAMDNLTLLSTLHIKDSLNSKDNAILIPGLQD